MKKLFWALALTGFVGAATINSVSAITHSKVVVLGGEDEKNKKEKKKKCCKTEASCKKDGEKKCCSKTKSDKSTSSTETKKVEVEKNVVTEEKK